MFYAILTLLALGIAIYLWLTWQYNYWQKLGIPYIKPSLFFGNTKEFFLGKENAGVVYQRYYNQYPNEPFVGLFKLRQPLLLLRDMDLIKTVLVKEFSTFHDNDFYVDRNVDPVIGLNPFVVKGDEWKRVRSIHTQKQTSTKIKSMYPMIEDASKDMLNFMGEKLNDQVESKYFSGQFTTDVVGSCVYGMKCNSFVDPNAKFRQISSKIFDPDTMNNMAFIMYSLAPKIASTLRLKMLSNEVLDFFYGVVKEVYDYRMKNNVMRSDYLGSLMEENKKSEKPVYSLEEITAHSLTFFFDGYETSSTLMGFTLYILSLYQDIQQKLRNEVNKAEDLTYDTVHNLPYLDAIINETLRMYPPGTVLSRECNKEIELSSGGKSVTVPVGMTVMIPMLAIHMDPEFFPQPDVYNPERFYQQTPSPYFFPFGLGPRACLGQRFALTQIKAGIAKIIKNFRILPGVENAKMPEINPKSPLLLAAKDPMWIKFNKI